MTTVINNRYLLKSYFWSFKMCSYSGTPWC